MRGDLECLLDTVMMVQERCAELADVIMESAGWEAKHLQAQAEYSELLEKYGSKSK